MMGAGRHLRWLGAACILAAALAWVFRSTGPEAGYRTVYHATSGDSSATASPVQATVKKVPRGVATAGLPDAVESPHSPGSTENEVWMEKRIEELEGLAWFNDAAALDKILAEMRNTQPEIRKAALEAAIAFGSKDAIPKLEILARGTNDLTEQKAIADAIEYLSMPTMVEHLEENPAGPRVDPGP